MHHEAYLRDRARLRAEGTYSHAKLKYQAKRRRGLAGDETAVFEEIRIMLDALRLSQEENRPDYANHDVVFNSLEDSDEEDEDESDEPAATEEDERSHEQERVGERAL